MNKMAIAVTTIMFVLYSLVAIGTHAVLSWVDSRGK